MNVFSWNCRGLRSLDSPTIPYLFRIFSQFRPTFVFLQETKCNVNDVCSLFQATKPMSVFGVDAVDTQGGFTSFLLGPLCR